VRLRRRPKPVSNKPKLPGNDAGFGVGNRARFALSAMQPLSDLIDKAASEIDAAADLAALDAVRVAYLGKKGALTARLKSLSQVPVEERPAAGQQINQAKQAVQERLAANSSKPQRSKRSWRPMPSM